MRREQGCPINTNLSTNVIEYMKKFDYLEHIF